MYNPEMFSPMLLEKYSKWSEEYTEYLLSEKFDGYRALYYNGVFRSRARNLYRAPEWFTKDYPRDVLLDGELFVERGGFSVVASTLKKKIPVDDEWKRVKFMVYDLPLSDKNYTERYHDLKELLGASDTQTQTEIKTAFATKFKSMYLVKQYKLESNEQLMKFYTIIIQKGGEGVVIRDSNSKYIKRRTKKVLKLKPSHDAEAVVTGYEMGDGKYTGLLGSLQVNWVTPPSKTNLKASFTVGSGLTDIERKNYTTLFKLGTVIKVKYMELSEENIPRHPVYLGKVPVEYLH